jgi:hypothetical protein
LNLPIFLTYGYCLCLFQSQPNGGKAFGAHFFSTRLHIFTRLP